LQHFCYSTFQCLSLHIHRALLKAAVIVVPILGCTWVFGLLAINEDTVVFAWIFTIFNSLQVTFLFCCYVYILAWSMQIFSRVLSSCFFMYWGMKRYKISVTEFSLENYFLSIYCVYICMQVSFSYVHIKLHILHTFSYLYENFFR